MKRPHTTSGQDHTSNSLMRPWPALSGIPWRIRLSNFQVRLRNWRNRRTARAYRHLASALRSDPGFARSWHANIMMPIFDATNAGCVEPVMSAAQASHIADRLMKHLFDVTMPPPP